MICDDDTDLRLHESLSTVMLVLSLFVDVLVKLFLESRHTLLDIPQDRFVLLQIGF